MYYKPNTYNDYASILNKCEKYEMKDIITDEIHYDFVDLCRRDEDKCGWVICHYIRKLTCKNDNTFYG